MKKLISNSLLLTAIFLGSLMNIMAAETTFLTEKSQEVSRQDYRSTPELFYEFSNALIKNISIIMKEESNGSYSAAQSEAIVQIQLLSDSINQIIRCTIYAPEEEAKECFTHLTKLKKYGDQELGEGFMETMMNPPQLQDDPNPIVEASNNYSSTQSHDPLMSVGPKI